MPVEFQGKKTTASAFGWLSFKKIGTRNPPKKKGKQGRKPLGKRTPAGFQRRFSFHRMPPEAPRPRGSDRLRRSDWKTRPLDDTPEVVGGLEGQLNQSHWSFLGATKYRRPFLADMFKGSPSPKKVGEKGGKPSVVSDATGTGGFPSAIRPPVSDLLWVG